MEVKPAHLRGYSGQLDAIRTGAIADIDTYYREVYTDYTGLDGVMYPVRWIWQLLESANGDWFSALDGRLSDYAEKLVTAARDYESADKDNSDEIETSSRDREEQSSDPMVMEPDPDMHNPGPAPEVADGYSSGPHLALTVPKRDTEFVDWVAAEVDEVLNMRLDTGAIQDALGSAGSVAGDVVDFFGGDGSAAETSISDISGTLNEFVKWFLGLDLAQQITPLVIGNPSALQAASDACGCVEEAFYEIGDDIQSGLDRLNGNWSSEDGASESVNKTIKDGWLPAMDGIAQLMQFQEEVIEAYRMLYENTIEGLLVLLDLWGAKVFKLLKQIRLGKPIIQTLWDVVNEMWTLIEDIWNWLVNRIEQTLNALQAIGEAIVLIKDYWIDGDFEAITS